jgi:hypothetical protein
VKEREGKEGGTGTHSRAGKLDPRGAEADSEVQAVRSDPRGDGTAVRPRQARLRSDTPPPPASSHCAVPCVPSGLL